MNRRVLLFGATTALVVGVVAPALARPGYLAAFKANYNTAQGKPALNAANCALCHIGMPNQARWNVYGEALRTNLAGAKMVPAPRITEAMKAVEGRQNPATGQSFLAMINGDRFPGSTGTAGGGAGSPIRAAWEPVFNNVNMDGLTKHNDGNWVIADGVLRYTGGGNGWMRSNKQYTNYSMVVVWRYLEPGTGANNDAGVFLKARPGDNGNPWPNSPQLNMGPQQNYGTIGGTQGSTARFNLIKPNDWNMYQVTVQGDLATLAINNTVAWDTAQGAGLAGPGHVGFQCENRPFEIAQWWITPLP